MMLALLRILRIGTIFSPAADVVAGLCLQGLPWSAAAARAVVASVLVYAAGMVLNDHADRHRDAKLRPERPIPAGEIGPSFAFTLGLTLLAAGVAVSPAWIYWSVMAVLVLAYDYALKHVGAVGAVTMGVLRALNLCSAAIGVGGLVPSQPLLIAVGAYALYVLAVTVLGMLEEDSRATGRAARSVQTVPPLAASLALLGMPGPWPVPVVGLGLAVLFLARAVTVRTWSRAEIRVSMTWLLLGTLLYTGLLAASADRWTEAAAIWLAVLPARWISRRISMT